MKFTKSKAPVSPVVHSITMITTPSAISALALSASSAQSAAYTPSSPSALSASFAPSNPSAQSLRQCSQSSLSRWLASDQSTRSKHNARALLTVIVISSVLSRCCCRRECKSWMRCCPCMLPHDLVHVWQLWSCWLKCVHQPWSRLLSMVNCLATHISIISMEALLDSNPSHKWLAQIPDSFGREGAYAFGFIFCLFILSRWFNIWCNLHTQNSLGCGPKWPCFSHPSIGNA